MRTLTDSNADEQACTSREMRIDIPEGAEVFITFPDGGVMKLVPPIARVRIVNPEVTGDIDPD